MEARDSGSKIRPLPIDDIDGDGPQHHPIEPRRRLLPLIVIVAGAIAFAVVARGLGVGESTDASPATTAPPAALAEDPGPTTTTTPPPPPPPTLHQMLPVVGDRLNLVALTTTAKVGQWDSELAFPSYNSSITQPQSAHYNEDGTRVAVRSRVGDGAFVIDSATSGAPAYIWDVTSGVWHNTDPSLFAWTEVNAEAESTVVRIADISGDTSAGVSALMEFTLPTPDHILRSWGDWGFVTTSGPTVYGFDPDGVQTRMTDGVFFDTAAEGMALLADPGEQGLVPFLLNLDGTRTELPSLDIGAADFRITADGSWVLATTIQEDGHTSILARTVRSRSTRLTSVDETARIVNMTWGDRLLVLQDVESSDLLFKDWKTGAEYRVTIEDPVAAVFLPDEFALGE